MKSAIKNALDQVTTPKAGYRPEAIVTMSEGLRLFLQGTASIFHESVEKCGSVDAAAGIIRVGMKKLEFPIWVTGITAKLDRTLIFHFRNGTESEIKWQPASRSQSWTPEMKAAAAERGRQKRRGK